MNLNIIFLFITFVFSSPAYEMEIIEDIRNFPTTGDIFKVPYKNDFLMCCANDKRKAYSRTDLSIQNILGEYTKGCRGFRLDAHILIFCYNQTCKYDNTVIGNTAQVYVENNSIIYHSTDGEKCIENNKTTNYQFIARLDCDAALPKMKMECPAFWKKGNCTVETVLKSSEACKHPVYKSKGTYRIKCINRRTFEKELHRLED
ncbi:hypothetical protein M9Y10_038694 [Tritrichomonas musculus]|uniref:SUEL-type lectin domain-containing protein n=1 Tax=Tritrichomonas musculus TaxID=1915356 RepID=A0ABR2K9R1_9EUKA